MSRVGKQPINIPQGVKVRVEGSSCVVEGGKNKLTLPVPEGISISVEADKAVVARASDEKLLRSLHGTIRVLVNNMITGVTKGFKKELEIIGVGYKAQLKGDILNLSIGFSHPVQMPAPAGIKISLPSQTRVVIEGIDKQAVGEFAACIRRLYPPEPYKGKGIRYVGEQVAKKLGKALAK